MGKRKNLLLPAPVQGAPSLNIEFIGGVFVPLWDIFLPGDQLPPCKPAKHEQKPDFDALCSAWGDQRVSPVELTTTRGYWRHWQYRGDRGERIVVVRSRAYSDSPTIEEMRAKQRALELYEGGDPVLPGERVEQRR